MKLAATEDDCATASMDHVHDGDDEEEVHGNVEAAAAAAAKNEEGESKEHMVAKGISLVLGPVIKGFDAGVEGAIKSQSVLASSIDRLTRELDKLLEDAPLPIIAQYATKIHGARRRVLSICSTLDIVQKRIDNIDRMLSAKGKHDIESSFLTKPISSVTFSSQQTDVSSGSNDANV